MVRYIIRRLLWVVVLLFLVSLLTFIIFYALPSADPAQLRAGRQPNPAARRADPPQPRPRQALVPAVLRLHEGPGAALRPRLQLPEQHLGQEQIFDRLPATISLAIGAAVLWLVIGIAVGIISAVRSRTAARPAHDGRLALVAISAPVYWLGLVALYLFSEGHRQVPPFFKGAGSYVPFSQDPSLWFQSLIMPWFVLAAAFAAFYARLLRAALIEVMSEDYIRTARAKGLPERRVISATACAARSRRS